ncbi:putative uncharacterized protein [Clostridium sp. CAG:1013]|nr:putative uncharacterized protein [Clostridium sp. CAG:1013]
MNSLNLLIVDDEYYTVESIKKKLDWEALGIQKIFCAYSFSQAQKIFLEQDVHILLSDIEMPKGSGLDLLEWAQSLGKYVACIFLTSHAEFQYASKALKLNSSDYLLKPVNQAELLEAVKKAIENFTRLAQEKVLRQEADFWHHSKEKLEEDLWRRLALGMTPSTPTSILYEISRFHLSTSMINRSYYFILIQSKQIQSKEQWEPNLLEYALKNILSEIFSKNISSPDIVLLNQWTLLIPVPTEQTSKEMIYQTVSEAHSTLVQVFGGNFVSYVTEACELPQIQTKISEGLAILKNQVQNQNVILNEQSSFHYREWSIPTETWYSLLITQNISTLRERVASFFREMSRDNSLTRKELISFYYDFIQLIYSALGRKGKSARVLLASDDISKQLEHACDSISNLQKFINTILLRYEQYALQISKNTDIITDIKTYVKEHINDELTRETISQAVYLSPDYISHLFKERTGLSLVDYINQQRIQHAQELLIENHQKIHDIAISCGFQNLSYFAKQFKKVTGMTPQEYRKRIKKPEN